MNSLPNRKLIWAFFGFAAVVLIYFFFELFSSVFESFQQFSSGEDFILFSGLDVLFYLVLILWAVAAAYFTPSSGWKKFAILGSVFILFAAYELLYDSITFQFIDFAKKDYSYSLCLKQRKHSKGFGNNYVFVRDINSCEKLVDVQRRYYNSNDLHQLILQIKNKSN